MVSSINEQQQTRRGRVRDARGRVVGQMDPVKIDLLGQASLIPAETLRAMVAELLPKARRQRAISIGIAVFTLAFVVGGHFIYFRFFSTWMGFDLVGTTIHLVQLGVILLGLCVTFRMARAEYRDRVTDVMLQYRHCPYCGYCLRGLPVEAEDGATVCPECGCAWSVSFAMDTLGRC